jgi:hypothetical protein
MVTFLSTQGVLLVDGAAVALGVNDGNSTLWFSSVLCSGFLVPRYSCGGVWCLSKSLKLEMFCSLAKVYWNLSFVVFLKNINIVVDGSLSQTMSCRCRKRILLNVGVDQSGHNSVLKRWLSFHYCNLFIRNFPFHFLISFSLERQSDDAPINIFSRLGPWQSPHGQRRLEWPSRRWHLLHCGMVLSIDTESEH